MRILRLFIEGSCYGAAVLAGLLALNSPVLVVAQDAPIISGAIGFLDSTNGGIHSFQPVLAPVVAVPLGRNLLAEARFDLREFYARKNGRSGDYQGTFFNTTTYMQLDYLAAPKLTITAGRFLTPFGTYNERLTPIWIPKFENAPLIYAIGTRTTGSSDGGMISGALLSTSRVQVSYRAYYSAFSSVSQFESSRSAGDRVDVYLPGQRLELGTSYARFLQGTHNNSVGAHVWWLPAKLPFQLRSEYAHGKHAQGYWVEAAYRSSHWGGDESVIGRLEPAFRLQQVFRNSPGGGDGLPSVDTKLADFGLDYHLPHEVRLNASYSRRLASTGKANIWNISLTYRFLTPLWGGHQ